MALLGFRLGLYPFARGRRPFLEGLGLTGGFLRSVGARSLVGATGAEQSEVWQAFDVGVHERIRLGRSDRAPWLGLGVSYGQTAYTMSSDGQLLSGMPSVDYRYVRPGLDFRAAFGPVTLAFGAGYRGVVAAGYLGEHFPSGSVRGVDVDASLLVALPKSFAIIVRGQFAQYFYTTNSAPSDVLYASNATDRYGSGTLAVAWLPRM